MRVVCNICGKEMFKVRDRDTGIVYWDCEKHCIFHHPVFEKEKTKAEKRFLEDLIN